MPKLAEARKSASESLSRPVVKLLASTGISPNALTWTGFALTVVAGALILKEMTIAAGVVVLVAGFFDMLDGALARRTNRVSKFGGVLDSTLDRLAEAVLMLAIMVRFAAGGAVGGVALTGVALVGSLMVSYLRARIEALGISCKEVGVFTRSERVIVLALGLVLAGVPYALYAALGVIAALSLYTAAERLLYAWRQTR